MSTKTDELYEAYVAASTEYGDARARKVQASVRLDEALTRMRQAETDLRNAGRGDA